MATKTKTFYEVSCQLYHIQYFNLRKGMGEAGFNVLLWPKWKELVANSAITQTTINNLLNEEGRQWLDNLGYDDMFDPDNCGFWADPKLPLGPKARKLYETHSLRVKWGKWGPEHISVPGNACGLDIDDGPCRPKNGMILTPHNVDSIAQATLLLAIFLNIADLLIVMSDFSEEINDS